MKVSRLIKPYRDNGKTNLGFCNKQAGVYLIYKNDKLRYIGFSASNLYKTLTRHFQQWNKKDGSPVVTYVNQMQRNDFKVRVCITTPARAAKLERALIMKYKPIDNVDKLKGYSPTPAETKALDDFDQAPVMTKAEWDAIVVPF